MAHTTEDILCAHCEEAVATHFTQPQADYDPACDACYKDRFGTCGNCGAEVPLDDIGSVQVHEQTHWSPAEWEPRCSRCWAGDPDDDGDAAYERWRDEQDERAAGLRDDGW